MKSQNRVVATFNDLEKAEMAKAKLGQAGINATVVDDSKTQRFLLLTKPLACDKVEVEEGEFEKARACLKVADATEHVLHDEVRCLKCGSPDVQYPQFTRNTIIPTGVGVLLASLHFIEKTFYCRDCHHTWPAKVTLRQRTDILNWPREQGGQVKEEKG